MTGKLIDNLHRAIEMPEAGISTRVLFEDEHVKFVALALTAGSEMSDHAAPFNVAIQVISGEARFAFIDGEEHELAAGAWIYVPDGRRHRVRARTTAVLTLTLIKSAKAAQK